MPKRNVRRNGEPLFINLIDSYPMSPEHERVANVLIELKQRGQLTFVKKQVIGETRPPPRSSLHSDLETFMLGRDPMKPTQVVRGEGSKTCALRWHFKTVASAASDIAQQTSRDKDSVVEHTFYPVGTTAKPDFWQLVAVTDTYLAGFLISRNRRIDLPRLRELISENPDFQWAAEFFEERDAPTSNTVSLAQLG